MWCKTILTTAVLTTSSLAATPLFANELRPADPAAPVAAPTQPNAPVGSPPGGTDVTAPGASLDILAFLDSFQDQLALHATAPARTQVDHGLYDLWHAILRPRIGRMQRRITELRKNKRWTFDESGQHALHLAPDAWGRVVREMAALYTELGSALKRYERASVSFTSPYGRGIDKPATAYAEYPLEQLGSLAMDRELHRRLRVRRVRWADEVSAYWRLLGRFHVDFLRSRSVWLRVPLPTEPTEMEQAHARYEQALERRRETLRMQMAGVRAMIAALQAAEENRLRLAMDAQPAGELRSALGGFVTDMRAGRLEARDYDGDSFSEYGQLLRSRWLMVRAKLLAKLSK